MDFLNLLIQNGLCMSAVICLLLMLRPVAEKRFGAGARYYAWLVVLVGLLVPFRLAPPAALWTLSMPERKPPIVLETPVPVSGERLLAPRDEGPAERVRPTATSRRLTGKENGKMKAGTNESLAYTREAVIRFQMPDAYTLVLLCWTLGMAASLCIQGVRHARFFRMVRRWRGEPTPLQREVLRDEAVRLGMRRVPRMWRCACVTSPMAAGLFRPVLLMPELDLSGDELRMVVRHELTHVNRRDLWVKALTLLSLIVHWFNPLVYVMARTMALDCEMACDASVLANADVELRKRYGEAILGVIRRRRRQRVALSTSFYEGKDDMKKRFHSMLDTRVRPKGGVLIALTLAVTLLSGGVIAVAQPGGMPETAEAVSITAAQPGVNANIPEDWAAHRTPEIFGITTQELSGAFAVEEYQVPEAWSRDLTRAEWMRLFDLYYEYDRNGLRAKTPVAVKDDAYGGERFALSVPVKELAALFPMEERLANDSRSALWAPAEAAGVLPFLLLPAGREMEDEELLELIEAIDAFNLLVPYVDPWREKDSAEYNNRDMTRSEMIRYEEIYDRCLRDEAFRPSTGLSSQPNDTVYIKGYNGGGETVYHYPEGREMTDGELLMLAYESAKSRLADLAEQDYFEKNIADAVVEPAVGTREEAISRAMELLGADSANVMLPEFHDAPRYNEEKRTWTVTLLEGLPLGAGSRYYSVTLDMAAGDVLELRQTYFSGVYITSYLGEISMNRLIARPVDVTDPRWVELAREYLSRADFYTGAQLKSVYASGEINGFCVWAEYLDGMRALIQLDPVTGELKSYDLMSPEEIKENWGTVVNR